ncbi:MAG: PIG-L family deacetylase [Bacteroidota bacterium]
MIRKMLLLLSGIGLSTSSFAQQVRPVSSATIYNEIAQLKNLTNVLYMAAHPDDENTRLLAWLANDQHIRTAYLSLTRGDGGQNILGSEQGSALGLIRTHELMEARKLDGAEQFFTRAVDFGFSKNPTETFKHWNDYLLTNDAVWVMRKFRPDVIISRFPPTSEAGHGQHSASAIIAAKAFADVGNKQKFIAQQQTYAAWQPKRLLFNSYRFGDRNTTSEDQFKLLVGQYIPTMGMGTGELAGISRSIHRSQGAGTPSTPGVQKEYFKLVAGDSLSTSLFDGIDITWNRVGKKEIGDKIQTILNKYNYNYPEASITDLLELKKEITTVQDDFWRKQKLEEVDKIILHCSGFMAELYTKQAQTVAGATLPFTLRMVGRTAIPVKVKNITWLIGDTTMNLNINKDSLISFDHNIKIPENTPVTEPYWMVKGMLQGDIYDITNDTLLGLPETPNNLNAFVKLEIGNETFTIPVPLSFKKLDPTRGDVVEALRIVPEVTLDFNSTMLVTEKDGSVKTNVHIHAYKDISNATLNIKENQLERVTISNINLKSGIDTTIGIMISATQTATFSKGDFYLDAHIIVNGKDYNRAQKLIQYSHLPTLQYFNIVYAKVLRSNWKCTAKRIGFIEGAGDNTATILRAAGLEVDVLKESELADPLKLKKYDAIITGVRAINTEKRMSYWMPVLLKYAENGGTLVMQYNTPQDMSTQQMGPYPFTINNDTKNRVTEENADVTMLLPNHRLMTYPNKITDGDFNDWVQERGLYFPTKIDEHYTTLFRMNDTGEEPNDGCTIYTKYGKGHYIYTSLSFFRQLPVGNKGAIRLLMNMISVGHNENKK